MAQDIKDLIKAARNQAGLSQQGLADFVGVSQQTIAKIETGRTRDTRHILKIIQILKMDIDAIDAVDPKILDAVENYTSKPRRKLADEAISPLIKMYHQTLEIEDRCFDIRRTTLMQRPWPLLSTVDGYAVGLEQEILDPFLGRGDVVLVDESRPIIKGSFGMFVKPVTTASYLREFRIGIVHEIETSAWIVDVGGEELESLSRTAWNTSHRIVGIYFR